MKLTNHVQRSGIVAVLASALVTVLAFAATSTSAKPAQAKTQKVDIKFAAVAGEEHGACGTPIQGLGAAAQAGAVAGPALLRLRGEADPQRRQAGPGQAGEELRVPHNPGRRRRDAHRPRERHRLVRAVDGDAAMNAVVRGTVHEGQVRRRAVDGGRAVRAEPHGRARRARAAQQRGDGLVVAGRAQVHEDRVRRSGRRTERARTAKTFFVHLGSARL